MVTGNFSLKRENEKFEKGHVERDGATDLAGSPRFCMKLTSPRAPDILSYSKRRWKGVLRLKLRSRSECPQPRLVILFTIIVHYQIKNVSTL